MTKQDVENVLNLVSNLNSKRLQHWSINCLHTQCLRICFLSISILAELFTGPTGAIFCLEFVNECSMKSLSQDCSGVLHFHHCCAEKSN